MTSTYLQLNAVMVSHSLRICRGCGCHVWNEFNFITQGLLCDACFKLGKDIHGESISQK